GQCERRGSQVQPAPEPGLDRVQQLGGLVQRGLGGGRRLLRRGSAPLCRLCGHCSSPWFSARVGPGPSASRGRRAPGRAHDSNLRNRRLLEGIGVVLRTGGSGLFRGSGSRNPDARLLRFSQASLTTTIIDDRPPATLFPAKGNVYRSKTIGLNHLDADGQRKRGVVNRKWGSVVIAEVRSSEVQPSRRRS